MRGEVLTSKYGYGKVVDYTFDEAVQKIKDALKEQGFGVLSEINVQQALKEKLGVDFPRYLILGACNPNLAYQALGIEPDIGLLLPCNVVVREREGKVDVSAIDAVQMLFFVGNPKLEPVAKEANERLRKALEAL